MGKDLIAAAVLVVFGAYMAAVGLRIPPGVATDPLGPRAFPVALSAGMAICGILLAAGALVFRGRPRRRTPTLDVDDEEAAESGPASPVRLIGAIAVTGVYLMLFEPLGYLLSTPLYVAGVLLLHGGAPRRALVITPVAVTLGLYATFKYGLLIPLPEGVLEPLLLR